MLSASSDNAAMSMHALDLINKSPSDCSAPILVLFGDESFLKRHSLQRITHRESTESDEFSLVTLPGDSAQWRDVIDELSTVSLFGDTRTVYIDQADDFISDHRGQLESYLDQPAQNGLLILDVESWPSNTRLYKAVEKVGLAIDCRPPTAGRGNRKPAISESRIYQWLVDWSASQNQATLQLAAARQLYALVGPQFGILDQELAKLSLYIEPGGTIDPNLVNEVVGGWRSKTTWQLIDAALDGDAAEALHQLEQLLQSGEHPVALFGQISWSLRRFATATRIIEQSERERRRISLRDALLQAGFPKWPPQAVDRAQQQLKQVGRQRADMLLSWLLAADLELKGNHSSPGRARFVLERLVLRLSKQTAPIRRRRAVNA